MKFEEFRTAEALRQVSEGTSLTDREQHLIGIAIAATRGCVMCCTAKTKAALAAGISREVILQAVDYAAQINAGVTVATALQGAQRAGIDDECSSGACELPSPREAATHNGRG